MSYPLWSSTTKWELALHTGSSVLSLLLLVLLENAGRRSEEAAQEKLNVLADGLAALMAPSVATTPSSRRRTGGSPRRSGSRNATSPWHRCAR